MSLDMLWLVDEWLLNAWASKCYCTYYERACDLLDDSQISIIPLCSNMHSWPVDYMFSVCLMKLLSCSRQSSSSFSFKFVCLTLFSCHVIVGWWKWVNVGGGVTLTMLKSLVMILMLQIWLINLTLLWEYFSLRVSCTLCTIMNTSLFKREC